jgi:hypothetical protein
LRRLRRGFAGAIAGTAAWCSLGHLAVSTSAHGLDVFGLAAHPVLLLALAIAGAAIALRVPHPPTALLALTGLIVLPWLGVPPAAGLLWQGVLTCGVWLVLAGDAIVRLGAAASRRVVWAVAAATLAALVTVAALTDPRRVSGDEPHYLIAASSVVYDGDVDLANDYDLGRHTDFYAGSLEPRHVIVTPSGHQYSFHGLGPSLLVLPAFALGGVHAARLFLALISALGALALWMAARSMTGSTAAAHAALAALILQVPFAAQAAGIYPDGPAAAVTGVALWTLVLIDRDSASRTRLVLTGAALSLLPWLHIRLAAVALIAGVAIVAALVRRERKWRDAAAFAAIPIAMAIAWWTTSALMFETLDPTAPFRQKAGGSLVAMPAGAFGLLADHEYGLLPYAPALALGVPGLIRVRRAYPHLVWGALVAFAVTLALGGSYVWWGGTSSPARFLVPVLPVLALGVGAWWAHAGAAARQLCVTLMALGATLLIAGVSDERGLFMSGEPDARDTVFDRALPLVDLPAALPSMFRAGTTASHEVLIAIVWVVVAMAGVAAFATTARRRSAAPDAWTLVPWLVAGWIAVSATLAWRVRGVGPVTADRAQMSLLQSATVPWRQTGVEVWNGFTARDRVLARLSFAAPGRRDEALVVPRIPPGTYRVESGRSGEPGTLLALELGRDAWPAWTWAASAPETSPEITLAAPVHSLVVRARPAANAPPVRLRVIRGATEDAARHTEAAVRVTRYGRWLVYSLDTSTAMETGGFWVEGGHPARILVADTTGRSDAVTLRVEAAAGSPVTLRIRSEADSEAAAEVALEPQARRDVPLPASAAPRVWRLDASAGSRAWITLADAATSGRQP